MYAGGFGDEIQAAKWRRNIPFADIFRGKLWPDREPPKDSFSHGYRPPDHKPWRRKTGTSGRVPSAAIIQTGLRALSWRPATGRRNFGKLSRKERRDCQVSGGSATGVCSF